MKRAALRLLACSRCGGSLDLTGDGADVTTGELHCAACGDRYPIVGGIPRFVGQVEAGVGVQADVYSYWHSLLAKESAYSRPRDLDALLRTLGMDAEALRGRTVLDAGCGSGRFTVVLSDLVGPDGLVVAMDLSRGVDLAREFIGPSGNCVFVQGNLLSPPFAPDAFDAIISWGVLHHTPRPRAAFATLAKALTPQGRFGVYVYEVHPVIRYDNWSRVMLAMTRQGLLIRPLRFLGSRLPVGIVEVLSRCAFVLSSIAGLDVLGCGDRRMRHTDWTTWRRVFIDRFHTRYASEHTVQEILNWFYDEGFDDVQVPFASAVTVSGRKGRVGPAMQCRVDYNLVDYRTDDAAARAVATHDV